MLCICLHACFGNEDTQLNDESRSRLERPMREIMEIYLSGHINTKPKKAIAKMFQDPAKISLTRAEKPQTMPVAPPSIPKPRIPTGNLYTPGSETSQDERDNFLDRPLTLLPGDWRVMGDADLKSKLSEEEKNAIRLLVDRSYNPYWVQSKTHCPELKSRWTQALVRGYEVAEAELGV